MNNPIDVLGAHPTGALLRKPDPRDYLPTSPEVGLASAPFDWQTGYDVEAELGFQLPTKNQGSSGSCGGQSMSYYGQVLSALYGNAKVERSAKYLYAQAYTPYGGGSDDRTLAKLAVAQGFGPEAACTSYDQGNPPTEAFMERVGDITPQARLQAAADKIQLAYVFPTTNLDDIASLMPRSKGGILLLHGSNNGTWLTDMPSPPSGQELQFPNYWTHYMYAGKAGIHKGQKGLWAKQSWGLRASPDTNAWQFLSEEYFASGNILSGLGMLFNPRPDAPPQHTFSVDLHLGDTGPEVTALQTFLAYDGEFNLKPTGYYGDITARAVLAFQLKYMVADNVTLSELGGHVCGPATRAKMNSLF